MPPPHIKKQVKSFIRRLGFLQWFLIDFALNANPLTNLLKKGDSIEWTPTTQESFNKIK